MSRHHPSCADGAHAHELEAVLLFRGHMIALDNDTTVLCVERSLADRIAELINRHGLADVPDHIPADVLWSPPRAEDVLIDWRLPSNPKECPREP
jgi:hypothetical protein